MSRAPNNPELHELANRLSRLAYQHSGPSRARANYCHRHNGHIRVTRNIRNELLTLGITDNMDAAAFFSDCLTTHLYHYFADLSSEPPAGTYNDPEQWLRSEKCAANIQIMQLASEVVGYLKASGYLCDYSQLDSSRKMAKLVISDFEAQLADTLRKRDEELDAVRARYKGIIDSASSNLERAQQSLKQLYKL